MTRDADPEVWRLPLVLLITWATLPLAALVVWATARRRHGTPADNAQ